MMVMRSKYFELLFIKISNLKVCIVHMIASLISHFRLALKAHCSEVDGSDCTPPIRYSWEIRRAGYPNKVENSDDFFTTGKSYYLRKQ